MPCHLGPSWSFAGACWGFAGPQCAVAGAYWDLAGALQDLVGTLRGRTVPSLRRPGISLGRCESSLRPRQGALDALKPRCGVLGACWGVGASLGPRGALGPLWRPAGVHPGLPQTHLGPFWGVLRPRCGTLGRRWGLLTHRWGRVEASLELSWGALVSRNVLGSCWSLAGRREGVLGLVEGAVGNCSISFGLSPKDRDDSK